MCSDISGVFSLSENLAQHRPFWFVGTVTPAISAADSDPATCTAMPDGEHLMMDLGFNANRELNVEVLVNSAYL